MFSALLFQYILSQFRSAPSSVFNVDAVLSYRRLLLAKLNQPGQGSDGLVAKDELAVGIHCFQPGSSPST